MAVKPGKKEQVMPKRAKSRPSYRTSLHQGRATVLKGALRRGRF